MNKFKKIYIIGNGVMGKLLTKRIKLMTGQKATLFDKDDKLKFVDGKPKSPNLIIVATPISEIGPTIKKICDLHPQHTHINEIGSVKRMYKEYLDILKASQVDRPGSTLEFNSMHPMVGPLANWEDKDWDKKCLAIFSTNKVCEKEDCCHEDVEFFWKSLGFDVPKMDYYHHDRIVGRLSHLSHFLIMKYVEFVETTMSEEEIALAGPSFEKFKEMAKGAKRLNDIYETNYRLPGLIDEYTRFLNK